MAYSSAVVSAADLALLAADKPIIAGIQSIGASAGRWVNSTTKVFSDTDQTNASFPVRNAYDGYTHVRTATTVNGTSHALLFDFGATGIEFDSMVYNNHNLYSSGCTALVVQVADDNAFSTNLISFTSINVTSLLSADRRFSRLSLFHTGATPLRYSTVRYVRLQMTLSGAGTPAIGEVAFCRRRQLKWQPLNEWDPSAMQGDVARERSSSGINYDAVFSRAARTADATWLMDLSAQQTDALAFRADTKFCTRPFVWIDLPNSAPNDAYMMNFQTPGQWGFPYFNWQARRLQLLAVEQGPYFLADVTT